MSTYYILVNKDLKEYLDAGDLNLNLNSWAYTHTNMMSLFGWLMIDRYIVDAYGGRHLWQQYDPEEDKIEADGGEFYFEGHWSHCVNVGLVSEHDDLYEISSSPTKYNEDTKKFEPHDWSRGYINISIPATRDYNFQMQEWWGDTEDKDTQEWLKHQLFDLEQKPHYVVDLDRLAKMKASDFVLGKPEEVKDK